MGEWTEGEGIIRWDVDVKQGVIGRRFNNIPLFPSTSGCQKIYKRKIFL